MSVFKGHVAILAQGGPSKLCHSMFSLLLAQGGPSKLCHSMFSLLLAQGGLSKLCHSMFSLLLAQGGPSKLCHSMFSLSLYKLAVRHYPPHLFTYFNFPTFLHYLHMYAQHSLLTKSIVIHKHKQSLHDLL